MKLDVRANGAWIRFHCPRIDDACNILTMLEAGGTNVDLWIGSDDKVNVGFHDQKEE